MNDHTTPAADPKLIEMVERWEAIHRLQSAALEANQEAEVNRLCDAQFELAKVILEWPARCVADLLAKARLIAVNQEELGDIAAIAEAARQCEPWSESGVALAVVRDLARMQTADGPSVPAHEQRSAA